MFFFHWSLVLLFFVAYITGDDKGVLHRYVGYVIFGLVLVRIVWGFCGTKHALFSDFICPPAKAIGYLKKLIVREPKYYIGHNPAAAWMILSLLILSMLTCVSGYEAFIAKGKNPSLEFGNIFSIVKDAYADDDKHEKHKNRSDEKERNNDFGKDNNESHSVWGDIHEMSAQFMLVFVCFHIIGVAVSSKIHNENLIKSMITGTKGTHGS